MNLARSSKSSPGSRQTRCIGKLSQTHQTVWSCSPFYSDGCSFRSPYPARMVHRLNFSSALANPCVLLYYLPNSSTMTPVVWSRSQTHTHTPSSSSNSRVVRFVTAIETVPPTAGHSSGYPGSMITEEEAKNRKTAKRNGFFFAASLLLTFHCFTVGMGCTGSIGTTRHTHTYKHTHT